MIEFIAGNIWVAWLVVSVVCLIIELTSFDFYVTCFAIGALGGMVGALAGAPLWTQALLWAVVSLLSICFIRPYLTHHLHAGADKRKSNADALIGKEGVVIEKIDGGGFGYVKIDGDEWRSVSSTGVPIEKGVRVRVLSRESIILKVETTDGNS